MTKEKEINNQDLQESMKALAEVDADAWVDYHGIVNEKGERIEWAQHMFQIDIYNDQSANLVVMKPAQVGLSTLEILKNFRDAEKRKMDIIYTLPTDSDVHVFVGGKVNRIIKNNPHMVALTADKDSV
jgi:phage terminase large subunit GpA-like protein